MGGVVRLDGPGKAKMDLLETSLANLQRVHGLVEQMAVAIKNGKPTQNFGMQIRRAATPMVGQLKAQFGMLSDQVAAMNLVAGRSGGDQQRLRALREQVALLRQALEIAQNKVKEQHAIVDDKKPVSSE